MPPHRGTSRKTASAWFHYAGLIWERRAKCQYEKRIPGCGELAYEGLRKAMEHYERAQEPSPEDNDDATLRWNSCARLIMSDSAIEPGEYQSSPIGLE